MVSQSGISWPQQTLWNGAAQSLACISAQIGASPAGSYPLLKQLHTSKRAHCTDANRNIPPFKIVLVSRCRDARATKHYFSNMPWAAMTHAGATGMQGLALMDKFGVTTIPALVLLDGDGALICKGGQEHL
jgi:hypothetical protein